MSAPRRLDRDRYEAARRFVLEQARPLEAARWRQRFEGDERGAALHRLADFQNDDGGFGQALEPDLRAPDSSAIGTAVALGHLRFLDALDADTLVVPAVRWLLDHWRDDVGGWRIVPETTDAHPHAPWWQQAGRDHDYDRYSPNPTAELLGALSLRRDLLPDGWLEEKTDALLQSVADAETIEMHSLLSLLRLQGTPVLDDAWRTVLQRLVDATVVRDPDAWAQYGLRPLQVVTSPSSPFLPGLEEATEANLDHLLDEQADDGAWYPTWSWGELWPEVWQEARREWAGVLTLKHIEVLRAFGRVEGETP